MIKFNSNWMVQRGRPTLNLNIGIHINSSILRDVVVPEMCRLSDIGMCTSFGPTILTGIQGFQIVIAAIQFIGLAIFNLTKFHR